MTTLDDRILRLRLLWLPKGIQEDKCKQLMENFHPKVEVSKAADEATK